MEFPTSSGIGNPITRDALVDLLGKPMRSPAPSSSRLRSTPSPAVLATRGKRSVEGARVPSPEWAGSRWECWSSPCYPASMWSVGPRPSKRPTPCWFGVAIQCSCRTGCGSPGSPTCCRRCEAIGVSGGEHQEHRATSPFAETYREPRHGSGEALSTEDIVFDTPTANFAGSWSRRGESTG